MASTFKRITVVPPPAISEQEHQAYVDRGETEMSRPRPHQGAAARILENEN